MIRRLAVYTIALLALVVASIACEPLTTTSVIHTTPPTTLPTSVPRLRSGLITYTSLHHVYDLVFDENGILWAVGEGGVVQWDTQAGTYIKYTTEDGLAAANVRSVAVVPDGALWFGTAYGVSRLDPTLPKDAADAWVTYTTKDGLAGNDVRAIALAPDGALWFGTDGNGVSRFDGETWSTYTTKDGLAHDQVRAIVAASDGTLWFGTRDGVSHFDPASSGKASESWMTYTTKDGLADNDVQSIAVASDGALWFGTRYGGVSRLDLDLPRDASEAWKTYTTENGLAGNSVYAIAGASDDALWFGTGNEGPQGTLDGVSRFSDQVWTTYTTEDGLVHNLVEAITVAPDGALWFGTYDGISCFDPTWPGEATGAWKTYRTDEGLPHNTIETIAVTRDGVLWLGAWDAGWNTYIDSAVSRFDPTFPTEVESWTTYTTEDDLTDDDIITIAATPDDTLWFGTRSGIVYQLEPDSTNGSDKPWMTYTVEGGLQTGFRMQAIAIAPDGAIWFGTYGGGVSRLDPALVGSDADS